MVSDGCRVVGENMLLIADFIQVLFLCRDQSLLGAHPQLLRPRNRTVNACDPSHRGH